MSGRFSKSKGKRAEREAVKLLQPRVERLYASLGVSAPQLERNLLQANKGGYDLLGLDWLAVEIKRQETVQLKTWWAQTVQQAAGTREAVLLYKTNRSPWRALVQNYLVVGALHLPAVVELDETTFLDWFDAMLEREYKKLAAL